jgi:hypothetical protein
MRTKCNILRGTGLGRRERNISNKQNNLRLSKEMLDACNSTGDMGMTYNIKKKLKMICLNM